MGFTSLLETTRAWPTKALYERLEVRGCTCTFSGFTPYIADGATDYTHWPTCIQSLWKLLGEKLEAAGLMDEKGKKRTVAKSLPTKPLKSPAASKPAKPAKQVKPVKKAAPKKVVKPAKKSTKKSR